MRLIDADALQRDIKKVLEIAQSCDLAEAVPFYRAFLECVEKAPTVDAVSVAHCSDCKFFHEHEDGEAHCGEANRKKILDVTCGSRTMWFNKTHPAAIYCDKRNKEFEGVWGNGSARKCIVHPDIVCDFTALPFADESFALAVFDPPHLTTVSDSSWMYKKYGRLDKRWEAMLHDGFQECMRVLRQDGVLIFKWSETEIPAEKVWKAIGQKPLFGHHSGKKSQTFWGVFMKGER